jgi:phospholipase C
LADVSAGTLPSVSWVIPPIGFDEHPSASPANGMFFTGLVLDALLSNPDLWSRTALILTYDENDGWFDHVPPPTAPAGTPGEYLTGGTQRPAGPLGLGFRVPALVISPFSRGGRIATETFDHTSQLKLIAERFGVEVPNVSPWRRAAVGDLTSALLGGHQHGHLPMLPTPSLTPPKFEGYCSVFSQETESGGAPPRVPLVQTMPNQDGGTDPVSEDVGRPARSSAARPGRSRTTVKSSYNHLMHG